MNKHVPFNLFDNLSIKEILRQYNTGELSPVDVARTCVSRMDRLNGRFKAMVAYDGEKVLEQAMEIEERIKETGEYRLLEGIPVGVKDIFNTADFPTQMGSPLWKGFTPGNDARTVFNIKFNGGIIAGKTETAEFAVHTLGDTLNPHNIKKTPGTSSSGSAVGIATGMFPAALGTQTAGSIVRPASFCGIYGCKPSFGLIPRTGTLKTTDSLDTIGYFVRHAEDLQTLFEVLRVHGPDYPISYRTLKDESRQKKAAGGPWKIAFVRTHTWKFAPEYARTAIEEFARKLSSNREYDVIDLDLPKDMERSHVIHSTIYNKTLSYYFKEEYERSELVSPIMNDLIVQGQKLTIDQYHKALKDQEVLEHIMDGLMAEYDVLISLSTTGEAPNREDAEKPDPSLMWTLTHLPVVSIPLFVSPNGLPFGAQVASRRYSDYKLFAFINELVGKEHAPISSNPIPEVG